MNPHDPATWTTNEKVELLTEAIKAVNPDLLIEFIRLHRISPNWGDCALPRGRTARQCEIVFTSMVQSGFFPGIGRSSSVREPGPSSTMKRPMQPDIAYLGGRQLQPRPQMASLDTMLLNEPTEPPTKRRRGRPTNDERARNAALRGEPFPPPPKHERAASVVAGPSTARPSSTAILAAQAVMTPPPPQQPARTGAPSTGTGSSSSGKRRRGRPSKAEQEARRQQEGPIVSPLPQATPSRYPDILRRDEPLVSPRVVIAPNPNVQTSRPDEPGRR